MSISPINKRKSCSRQVDRIQDNERKIGVVCCRVWGFLPYTLPPTANNASIFLEMAQFIFSSFWIHWEFINGES